MRLKATAGCGLFILAMILVSGLTADADTMEDYGWVDGYSMVVTDCRDIASLNEVRDLLVRKGATVSLLIPPRILLGWVPEDLSDRIVGSHGIEGVHYAPVSLEEMPHRDADSLTGARIFNSMVDGTWLKTLAIQDQVNMGPLVDDILGEGDDGSYDDYIKNLENLGWDVSALAESGDLLAMTDGRGISRGNSDEMVGTVAAALFFVESDGTIDPDDYTWTEIHQEDVKLYAANGLNWLVSVAAGHGMSLSFTLYFYDRDDPETSQPYEPVLHSSSQATLWITQIMLNLGYAEGSHSTRVQAFNTDLKATAGTDWAYSAFVGYNPSPAPNEFTNGHCAWAYGINGPYCHMLYRNCGYPISHFSRILSHETSHLFGACDEYEGSCSNCGQICNGYNPIPNMNCEVCTVNEQPCLMLDTSLNICPCTAGQLGWTADADRDCWDDGEDNCPNEDNYDQTDSDGDDFGEVCDNCPDEPNGDQLDGDGDDWGAACDCDDTRTNVNPGLAESDASGNCADGLDNDCDGQADGADSGCGSGTCFLSSIL